MKYQENNYFNEIDDYLIRDPSINLNFVSKLHFYNGNWYSNTSKKTRTYRFGNKFRET